jgi:hypothetical protein
MTRRAMSKSTLKPTGKESASMCGVGKCFLDQHTFGVASDDVAGRGDLIVEQDPGLILTGILDEELTEWRARVEEPFVNRSAGAVFAR